MQENATITLLDEKMQESLQQAFANNELEGGDAARVSALWAKLMSESR